MKSHVHQLNKQNRSQSPQTVYADRVTPWNAPSFQSARCYTLVARHSPAPHNALKEFAYESSSLPHCFTSWWRLSASFLVKVFPHPPLQTKGLSPVCVSRCLFRSCWRLKDKAHWSQENGRVGDAGYWAATLIE